MLEHFEEIKLNFLKSIHSFSILLTHTIFQKKLIINLDQSAIHSNLKENNDQRRLMLGRDNGIEDKCQLTSIQTFQSCTQPTFKSNKNNVMLHILLRQWIESTVMLTDNERLCFSHLITVFALSISCITILVLELDSLTCMHMTSNELLLFIYMHIHEH